MIEDNKPCPPPGERVTSQPTAECPDCGARFYWQNFIEAMERHRPECIRRWIAVPAYVDELLSPDFASVRRRVIDAACDFIDMADLERAWPAEIDELHEAVMAYRRKKGDQV